MLQCVCVAWAGGDSQEEKTNIPGSPHPTLAPLANQLLDIFMPLSLVSTQDLPSCCFAILKPPSLELRTGLLWLVFQVADSAAPAPLEDGWLPRGATATSLGLFGWEGSALSPADSQQHSPASSARNS